MDQLKHQFIKMHFRFIFSITLLFPLILNAQTLVQNIIGKIYDLDTNEPLPGVHISVEDSDPFIGTSSLPDGSFLLENVPVGRHNIHISYIGYDPVIIRELLVGSGKEVIINQPLKQSTTKLDEVVVKAQLEKDKARNDMAFISTRTFSIEEASRYAGGFNDPSRLAGSFAGVTMAEGINDNAIVVRGNAPKGLLWKLEGTEIPAPNHLSGVYNGGGIETVFSANMLANSDFLTSAFPAEYNNALSGVFDIQFRNGNNRQRESAIQAGSQGIDISSEGPFKKGNDASYLFNYRYSTFGLIKNILSLNVGLPSYQDFSFKIYCPSDKYGQFSLWSINGLSEVEFNPEEDISKWETSWDNNRYETHSDISASGLTHQIRIIPKGYLKSTVSFSYQNFSIVNDQLQRDETIIPIANHHEQNYHLSLSTYLNTKISVKHTNKSGFTINRISYSHLIEANTNLSASDDLSLIDDSKGNSGYQVFFSESKINPFQWLTMNVGISSFHFNLTNEFTYEPRVGVNIIPVKNHQFSIGCGIHSKLEPLRFYLAKNDNGFLNPDLKITKAQHFVLGYDWKINHLTHIKIEPYYQYLYDVPVIKGTPVSLINYTNDMYFDDALNNSGTGVNKGIDMTIERFMSKGYYYLFTGSWFDSKYKGGDGTNRNSTTNRNFVFNLLGGKEWQVHQNNLFSVNGKATIIGGNRFTPPDIEKSVEREMVIEDENRMFEWQEPTKYYIDLSLNYRINKKKNAQIIIVQVKNLLLQSEVFGWAYNFKEERVVPQKMTIMYPYISYKIEF